MVLAMSPALGGRPSFAYKSVFPSPRQLFEQAKSRRLTLFVY